MPNKRLFCEIAVWTNVARVQLSFGMPFLVPNQVFLFSKLFLTGTTHKGFFAVVQSTVQGKAVFVAGAFLASTATVRHVTGTCFHVTGELSFFALALLAGRA